MIALTSCTGKLGGATLNAILEQNLIPPSKLVICTSSPVSDSRWAKVTAMGVQVRSIDFESPSPPTFDGCTKLFLVSSPDIKTDFNNAALGGREKTHIGAIKAAVEAGVKHIFYTSLAFGSHSGAGVMRAHLRTEEFLKGLKKDRDVKYTILREGLYNESWPLYLGYFKPKDDERSEVVLAGDGKISWTAISDLGLGTALILAGEGDKFAGRTIYLSATHGPKSLNDIAAIVTEYSGKNVSIKIVGREEYVDHYAARGVKRDSVEWWSTTYAALTAGECEIQDRTLEELLRSRGVSPKSVEQTVHEMLTS